MGKWRLKLTTLDPHHLGLTARRGGGSCREPPSPPGAANRLGVGIGIWEGDQDGLPHLPNSQSEFCERRLDGGFLLGGEAIDAPEVKHSFTPLSFLEVLLLARDCAKS